MDNNDLEARKVAALQRLADHLANTPDAELEAVLEDFHD